MPLNLRSQVFGSNLALPHGHVPKLWALEVHAVAHSIGSLHVRHLHCGINAHVSVFLSYLRAEHSARTVEGWANGAAACCSGCRVREKWRTTPWLKMIAIF